MRIAVLVPAPDYPEPLAWAYDVEAAALAAAGAEVEPVAWTEAEDLTDFDLVLPLVAWGYHLEYERWLAFLQRAEADRQSLTAAPVERRQGVSRGAWRSRRSDRPDAGGRGLLRRRSR